MTATGLGGNSDGGDGQQSMEASINRDLLETLDRYANNGEDSDEKSPAESQQLMQEVTEEVEKQIEKHLEEQTHEEQVDTDKEQGAKTKDQDVGEEPQPVAVSQEEEGDAGQKQQPTSGVAEVMCS